MGGSDAGEEREKERQLKEGAMRVSCATSTLVAKIERPQTSVTVREVVKGGSTYRSVRSRKLHAPGTNAYATVNVPTNTNTIQTAQAVPKTRPAPQARAAEPAFCNSRGVISVR